MTTTMEPDTQALPATSPAPTPRRPAATPATAAPGGRKRIIYGVLTVAVLALLTGGVRAWWFGRNHVRTDNAQVDGYILPILPKVGGFVTAVRVVDNQHVKLGDTLVALDDRDYVVRLQQADADLAVALANTSSRQRVGQAEAMVQQAQANADKAHADLTRILPLVEGGIVSKQQFDAATATAQGADAALAAAQAALVGADAHVAASRAARDQAALNVSYTRIVAPMGGVVSKKSIEVGQLVQPGQPLMAVVPMDSIWVTANLKETETENVTAGDVADITVDAYPGRHVAGHVESLSPATGARFSLLPPDNATGNFTKVVQRVPVRIKLDKPNDPVHPLRPGMSVVVTITTK